MHKISIFTLATASLLPLAAYAAPAAKAPFSLVSSSPKTLSSAQLEDAEKTATAGTLSKDKKSLTFGQSAIRLVVRTGPEDDMLSYRIAGVRSPTLIVPAHAVLKVLFVNTDGDMKHDIHFGSVKPPFPIAPDVAGTVGTAKLPHEENGTYSGEELTVAADQTGSFFYFCSVKGHAKGGMFGQIAVGTAPDKAPAVPDGGMAGMDMSGMDMGGSKKGGAMAGMDMGATKNGAGSMAGMKMGTMAMSSTVDLSDPMSRESSGTAWLPDSSPIYARMKMRGKRMLMFHGDIFPRYTRISTARDVSTAGRGGRSRFDAPSMFMVMASQPAGKRGQIGLRAMFSLDPIIEQGYGYPLLYQSGEAFRGQAIHDRQHPHDLVSELSATYSQKLSARNSAYLYLGYPGEPALGPPTFMHRPSAMDSPDAPISHHWQDATHVTFGVATLGFRAGRVKIEGSVFKGEEPNENRYSFDTPRLDSLAGRLSWNPTRDLAFQVSHGFLKKPEPAEPAILGRHRTTASIIYNRSIGRDSNWANTLVWGQNSDAQTRRSNSYLLETNFQRRENTIYARLEHVQKSGGELSLLAPLADGLYAVNAYSIGAVRDLKRGKGLDVGLGAQVTFDSNPGALNAVYGGRNHTGFEIFLRIRPSRLRDDVMSGMKMDTPTP